MATLHHYLILSAVLFGIGAFGVCTRRNLIIILLSIEIMLNAANLSFIAFSHFSNDLGGQVFSLFVIAIAASEVAIGLAIALLMMKKRGTLDPNELNVMKD